MGAATIAQGDDADALGKVVDLFDGVRIPNIVVATDGSVLAFGKSGGLVRRSTDGGQTWSEMQPVGEGAHGSAVVDRTHGDVMVVSPRASLWRTDHGQTWRRGRLW